MGTAVPRLRQYRCFDLEHRAAGEKIAEIRQYPCSQPQDLKARCRPPRYRHAYSLARAMYSPVRVSTLFFSPISTNSGTLTTAPVSRVAGFLPPVAVSPRT